MLGVKLLGEKIFGIKITEENLREKICRENLSDFNDIKRNAYTVLKENGCNSLNFELSK